MRGFEANKQFADNIGANSYTSNYQDIQLNVATDNPVSLPNGTGIEYLEQGSVAGVPLEVDIGGGAKILNSGDRLTGLNFSAGTARRAPLWYKYHGGPTATVGGLVVIRVYRTATAAQDYEGSNRALKKNTMAGALYDTQALSMAAPTLATDGIPVVGCEFFWAYVKALGVETITAGSVNIWRADWDWVRGGINWVLVGNVTLPTGANCAGIPCDWVGVQDGRIYIQTVGVTSSAAGATVDVYVRAR